jgi:molybdopterin synthase sulfur carrier subunit
MLSINVQYFASFREQAGVDSELFECEVTTLNELYEKLSQKYQFALPANMIQVAVNDEFASMNDLVVNHTKVVFIPPVAGG